MFVCFRAVETELAVWLINFYLMKELAMGGRKRVIESEEEMGSAEEQEETRQQEESLEQESEEGEFSLEISLSIESVDLRGEQDVSVAYELCCDDGWAVA